MFWKYAASLQENTHAEVWFQNKVAKQLYWNHTLAWVLSCKLAAYFQSIFSQDHPWMTASKISRSQKFYKPSRKPQLQSTLGSMVMKIQRRLLYYFFQTINKLFKVLRFYSVFLLNPFKDTSHLISRLMFYWLKHNRN